MMKTYFTSLLVVLLGAQWATGCVYLMGESKDSVAAHPAGTPWNYGFRGNDWQGVDGKNVSWTCTSGARQSPLNLFGYGNTPKARSSLRTSWSYSPLKSNGSNIQVFNNGHTIQVQWLGTLNSNVQVVTTGKKVTDVLNPSSVNSKNTKKVQLTPLQFHFHTTSEHTIDGVYYPLELHIVHSVPQSVLPGCPPTGCLSVTGIMFKLADNPAEDNPVLDAIWASMPEREGVVNYMPAGKVLDLESLLPKNTSRSYMQYEGSLTTPPCTEGLLWHVLREPLTISLKQLDKYARSVGLKECEENEPEDSRRRLQSGEGYFHRKHGHGHSHSHAAASPLDRLAAFERGSYSGFVHSHELGHHARMLNEDKEDAGNWTCTVVSFGFTNRNVQAINKRPILSFAKM